MCTAEKERKIDSDIEFNFNSNLAGKDYFIQYYTHTILYILNIFITIYKIENKIIFILLYPVL